MEKRQEDLGHSVNLDEEWPVSHHEQRATKVIPITTITTTDRETHRSEGRRVPSPTPFLSTTTPRRKSPSPVRPILCVFLVWYTLPRPWPSSSSESDSRKGSSALLPLPSDDFVYAIMPYRTGVYKQSPQKDIFQSQTKRVKINECWVTKKIQLRKDEIIFHAFSKNAKK